MTKALSAEKPFLNALRNLAPSPPPVWLMRQAGRYLPEYRAIRAGCANFLDLCYSPDKATEVTLQPIERFHFDAAIIFSDILVIPHALGRDLTYRDGEGPRMTPLRNRSDLLSLTKTGVLDRLAPIFETTRRTAKALPPNTALIGFAGAPWTVACYMVEGQGSKEFNAVRRMAYGEDALFQELIDILVDVTADYLDGQILAGAEAIQIFDSWAGLLPEKPFRRWSIEPTKRLIDKLKGRFPDVPVIGFPKGAGPMLSAYAEESGVTAIGLDQTVPLGWALKEIPSHIVLQGNLDPALLLVGGQALDDGIDDILEKTKNRAFIFNLGHGVLQETPPDHVQQLVERIRKSRA